MIKLGITGNIASGKSLVESFLEEEKIPVIDADKVVHCLLDNDKETIEEVYQLFKKYGYDVKGKGEGNINKISREDVGKIVFKDKNKLKELEKIIHPKVKKKIKEFFEENEDKKIVAASIPLLFESGLEGMFDYTIAITIDPEIQLERLMKRSNLTKEEALNRINAQIPQEEKVRKADFVIDNSENIGNTRIQLNKILEKIRQ